MGNETEHALMREFDEKKALYDAFGRSVADLIERLVQANGIDHLPIEQRTKERSSLSAKIARPEKSGKYTQLSDLTDISGVRIIAFLREDCKTICRIVEENFIVDYENSSDKEALLDPDRFGYTSVHYVVSHNRLRTHLPEFSGFDGLKAELQIRTVLQHSWAAIDWKLRYKSSADVPQPLRRRLYRINALLEAADTEFSAIAVDAKRLRADYREKIVSKKYDIPIDAESIEIYCEVSEPLKKLVAAAHRSNIRIMEVGEETHGRLPSLILALGAGGFKTLGEIDAIIKRPQRGHIANLKKVFSEWKDTGGFNYLSIETMIRVLVTLSSEKDVGEAMIKGAPINISLGLALRNLIGVSE